VTGRAGLVTDVSGVARCWWGASPAEYRRYHDREWGRPVTDDRALFEKICLEGFQSGLSWLTILRKRAAFRRAFAGFDFHRVARFGARDVRRLLAEPAIVRHRGKIESTINNARRALELCEEAGSIARWVWQFEPAPEARPRRLTRRAFVAMSTTPGSIAMSKELKRRGWTYIGPTTSYAFMQAMGLVNDRSTVEEPQAWVPRPPRSCRSSIAAAIPTRFRCSPTGTSTPPQRGSRCTGQPQTGAW
jgi:DNA-3-methyladenine glycosylase I